MDVSGPSIAETAIALFARGQYAQALDAVEPALRHHPSLPLVKIAALCAQALDRLPLAEQHWQHALRLDPRCVDAHNNLGILYHRTGRAMLAGQAYCQALQISPEHAPAHYNLGLLAQQSGNLAEAEACYLRALALQPDYADAHNNLGALYQARGDLEAAQACYRRALACQPDFAAAKSNLAAAVQAAGGQALHRPGPARRQAQDRGEAIARCRRLLACRPDHVEALQELAGLLQLSGQMQEAEACYVKALGLRPDSADLQNNFAVLLARQGGVDAAQQAYMRSIALNPGQRQARFNLALLYLQAGRFSEAHATLTALLALHPQDAEAHNSLGELHQRTGCYEQARQAYGQALALRPHLASAYSNLGTLDQLMGDFAGARANYEAALRCDPRYPQAQWNLGFLLLYLGQWERGWALMEARYDPALARPISRLPALPFPQWRGEDLRGKSIVVWPEQGFGDEIQFVRYLPLLKAAGAARVTLVCKPALLALMRSASGADEVVAESEAAARLGRHDYWTLIMSLPLCFATTTASLPARLPYLAAEPARIDAWRTELPASGFKVGLAWKGYGGHANDAHRSIAGLSILAPLWKVPGVSFVSLQRGMDGEPAPAADMALPITDAGARIADFADTAAIVSQLDLVICVDTAVAHVAGALGKRCWVLLPKAHTDWRWLHERADSPWYPQVMQLFRQQRAGDWAGVIQKVKAALEVLVGQSGAAEAGSDA